MFQITSFLKLGLIQSVGVEARYEYSDKQDSFLIKLSRIFVTRIVSTMTCRYIVCLTGCYASIITNCSVFVSAVFRMRYGRSRLPELIIVTVFGVGGGFYVFQPTFRQLEQGRTDTTIKTTTKATPPAGSEIK